VQISGEIVVGVDCVSFENATAFVYLEDVSRLDSGALLIGTAMIATVRHRAGTESRLPFAVQGVDVPRERDIAVRVHIPWTVRKTSSSTISFPPRTSRRLPTARSGPRSERSDPATRKKWRARFPAPTIEGVISVNPRFSGIRRN
jgi:hypothetical protein